MKKLTMTTLLSLSILLVAGAAMAETHIYTTELSGANEVPPNESPATGTATLSVDTETLVATWEAMFSGLTADQTGAHFHNAPAGANGGVMFGLPLGSPINGTWEMDQAQYDELVAGNVYLNIHTVEFPGGEIRGQMMLDTVGAEARSLGAIKSLFE